MEEDTGYRVPQDEDEESLANTGSQDQDSLFANNLNELQQPSPPPTPPPEQSEKPVPAGPTRHMTPSQEAEFEQLSTHPIFQ